MDGAVCERRASLQLLPVTHLRPLPGHSQVEKVHGVTMHRNCAPLSCERQADGRLTYRFKRTDGTEGEVRDVDQVLMATGRKPNSANLGLEAAGVQTNPEVRGGVGWGGVGGVGWVEWMSE